MPWIGPASMSARDRDLVAVATRPLVFGVVGRLDVTFFFAAGFGTARCFATEALLRLAVLLFETARDRDLAAAVLFLAGFLAAVAFLRPAAFVAAFLGVADFLLTFDFFPVDFFLDDDPRVAAFRRGADARARCLLVAFLAAIPDSCRSEKNAELYIACVYMEAQKQAFFRPFSPGGSFRPRSPG